MKVKIEIEFEMENINEESPIISEVKMINSLEILDNDIIDGFEVTTTLNPEKDFYIVPNTARIINKSIVEEN